MEFYGGIDMILPNSKNFRQPFQWGLVNETAEKLNLWRHIGKPFKQHPTCLSMSFPKVAQTEWLFYIYKNPDSLVKTFGTITVPSHSELLML